MNKFIWNKMFQNQI